MKTIAEKAAEYLDKNGHDGVMWGDVGLLHEIAEYAGLPHRGWRTEQQVLNAIGRGVPELFEKRWGRGPNNKPVRLFKRRKGK